MSSTFKKCRVCGKEYEACRSANRGDSVFRWREVACSPGCGEIYLKQINESRNHTTAHKKAKRKVDFTSTIEDKQTAVETVDEAQLKPADKVPMVEE